MAAIWRSAGKRRCPALGYELVDWDMSPRTRLVRVFIDKPTASTSKTARASATTSRACSPSRNRLRTARSVVAGLDRPLKKPATMSVSPARRRSSRFASRGQGEEAQGILRGIEGEAVLVETAAGVRRFRCR
jgi:ribosome maturation factor RimP